MAGQKVKSIDVDVPREWTFARGWAFFELLEAKHGADRLKKFVALALQGTNACDAAATAVGSDWAAIAKAEAAWSAGWLRTYSQ